MKFQIRGVTIDGAKLEARLRKHLRGRMTVAVLIVEGAAVRKISRGQPVKRVGGRLVGLDPSKPGEPPKVVTARLKQSVSHVVGEDSRGVYGRVGTNVKYGRSLEFGDPTRRLLARPWLRPSLAENGRLVHEAISHG